MDYQEAASEGVLCLLITSDHLLQRVVKAWVKRVFLSASHRNEGPWFTSGASSEQRYQDIVQRASAYY